VKAISSALHLKIKEAAVPRELSSSNWDQPKRGFVAIRHARTSSSRLDYSVPIKVGLTAGVICVPVGGERV
jgi:hypothetical protein